MNDIFAINKKLNFDFKVESRFECGLVLNGNEVKSIRSRNVDISSAYISFDGGVPMILNMHIASYKYSYNIKNNLSIYNPKRSRNILLKKEEIKKIYGKYTIKGYTVLPYKLYLKKRFIKLEIVIVEAKNKKDKREYIKQKDLNREEKMFLDKIN